MRLERSVASKPIIGFRPTRGKSNAYRWLPREHDIRQTSDSKAGSVEPAFFVGKTISDITLTITLLSKNIPFLFFFPLENPMLFIIINGICYLGVSGFQVLVWALVNDAIDYQELQTGKRNEGIVYSAYTFFRKLANAVSGSMSSFALAIAGFNVNEVVQSEAFSGRLWKTYTGLYVAGYLLAVLVLKFVYPLTKEKTAEMLQNLSDKRNAANAE